MHEGVALRVDDHLDRVDRALDDIAAGRGAGAPNAASVGGSVTVSSVATAAPTSTPSERFEAGLAIANKPQDAFSPPPDNAPGPFFPPPPVRLSLERQASFRSVPGSSPIAPRIDALVYPEHALAVAEDAELLYDARSEARAAPIFVDTETGLRAVADDLRRDAVTAFAVDLEHHSHRSFQGFTCLVQVSTRERDYVIDVLVPAVRAKFRAELGASFEDPRVTKIMHGAEYDVKWLQRDFGVYVVNMFDTGQAARVLQFPKFSLAYLLKHFCGVDAEKQYQLADWRARPLSAPMLAYASGDTKHLPYVYDVLKRRLRDASAKFGDGDLVMETLKRSETICKLVYVKPTYDVCDSWRDEYLRKVPANERDLDSNQLAAFAAAHAWRDATARALDESPGYIVSRALLLRIARALPATERALLAITRGDAPALASRAAAFLDVTRRAAASGAPPEFDSNQNQAREGNASRASRSADAADAAGAADAGGARGMVTSGGNASSEHAEPSEGPAKKPEVPPASFAPPRTSAMAAMMGGSSKSSAARAPTGEKRTVSPMSAMARAMASFGHTASADHLVASKEDRAAAETAARVRESMADRPVSLAEVFGFSENGRFAETDAPVATGRHARAENATRRVNVSTDDVTGDDTPMNAPTPVSRQVTGETSHKVPAPLRRDQHAEKRRKAAAEAEAEAATKARASAARDALARRRGRFGEASDSEASDSEDGGLGPSVDPEDEAALRAVGGGAGGFDFAAAAAAAMPSGASFAALGARSAGRRRKKGDAGAQPGGASLGVGKTLSEKRRKSGKYDANGRMIMVEPFKPGKKSKAFPRSGERNATFG